MYVGKTSVVNVGVSEKQKLNANFNGKIASSRMAVPSAVRPSSENLKAYYLRNKTFSGQTSFGRLPIEHLEHGAYVDEAKNVLFKLLTFPDVQNVSVVIAREVEKLAASAKKEYEIVTHSLKRDFLDPAGVFHLRLGSEQAKSGDKYAFEITKSNGEKVLFCDPYAQRKSVFFKDPSEEGAFLADKASGKAYQADKFAEIYDHHAFKWSDDSWMNGKVKTRISRIASAENGLIPLSQARICEISIPTFSQEGTFDSAIKQIEQMIAKGDFLEDGTGTYNAIELTPVETAYAAKMPTIGYDGVYKGAPQEELGGPDGLKKLVDFCHKKGINVFMDSVPNHSGADNNFFAEGGPYTRNDKIGQFGPLFNFENDFRDNKHVRDLVVNLCCLNWLKNYHIDHMRLDFTKDMDSDMTLRQLFNEMNFHHPHATGTVEDCRAEMLHRLLLSLSKEETCENLVNGMLSKIPAGDREGFRKTVTDTVEQLHASIIKYYDDNSAPVKVCNGGIIHQVNIGGLPNLNIGANSRWAYEYKNAITNCCNNRGGNVSDLLNESEIAVKTKQVVCPAYGNHDETQNEGGLRTIAGLVNKRWNMINRVAGDSLDQKGKRANRATLEIVQKFATGEYQKLDNKARAAFLKSLNINGDVTANEVKTVLLDYALSQNKLSVGYTATLPTAYLNRVGDVGAVEGDFFCRAFTHNTAQEQMERQAEKGYATDMRGIIAGKPGAVAYSEEYQGVIQKANQFIRDLIKFKTSNSAMNSGSIYESSTVAHNSSGILGMHLKKDSSEVFTVSNFSDFSYAKGEYEIQFPAGKWKLAINSDDAKYAGRGDACTKAVSSSGQEKSKIAIPRNALLVFEKVS